MDEDAGFAVDDSDRVPIAVEGIMETSREDCSMGLERGELPAMDVALIGVSGILVSIGSSSGNGRFKDEAASVVSAIVDNC